MSNSLVQRRNTIVPWAEKLRVGLVAYAFLGAAVSLLAWVLDVPRLADWDGSGVSTQPNSAVAAMAAGLGIFLLFRNVRYAAILFGGIAAAIGLLSLFQLVTHTDVGINQLLLFGREWGRTGAVTPGQVGFPGSASWSLIGTGVILAAVQSRPGAAARGITVAFAVVCVAIATLSITGYLYGATVLYELPRLTVIAFQTATFVLALSVALLFGVPEIGPAGLLTEQGAAGLMARRVIPAIIVVPLLLGFVRLAGERQGYYDLAFGMGVGTLLEISLLLLLLVWTAQAVRRVDRVAQDRARSLRNLADSMPQVIWIADASGRVHYYNGKAEGFGGIAPASANTFDWQPGMHEEDLQPTLAAWNDAVKDHRLYQHEHRILMADGTYRWHLSRATPVSDGNGSHNWYGTATDIHDLKIAEQLVRENEERFALFMHHLPGLAWIKDRLGRYVYVNDAAEKAFQKPKEELYGRTDREIFPPEIAEVFVNNDQRALETDSGVQVIESLRNDDGETRESIVSKFRIARSGGEPLIGGMAIDITEQRKAQLNEAFLFRVAERIRTAVDPNELVADVCGMVGGHLGVHRCFFGTIDLGQRITTIANDFAADSGSIEGVYPVTEFSTTTFGDLMVGRTVINRDTLADERSKVRFEEVYAPGKILSYVNVPLLRDGELVGYFFVSHKEGHDWTPAETLLIETVGERVWSAAERIRAEHALRASEERYRVAQQAGNVGIWDWNISSGKTYWSEQMWTLYDEEPQAIDPDIGFWNSHLHPDDRKKALDVFERTLESRTEHHNDVFRIVRRDNTVRWIESIATVERDGEGRPVRMYGVNLDITELQVAHDELEIRVVERTQELAKANTILLQQMEERAFIEEQRIQLLKRLFTVQEDERGRIARDIHDHLGQRLTALRLKIASVRSLCQGQELLEQRVTRLQEISELLDKEVSFLAWELRPDILDKTDFVHALEQYVVEWSRHSEVFAEFSVIGLRDAKFDKDIENNLYRITQEALNNAAKYSQATQINVILEQRDKNLILIIEDNGIGFDAAAVQSEVAMKGFGLVGMRERASLIGGTLEIESAPGDGTTIFVKAPFEKD